MFVEKIFYEKGLKFKSNETSSGFPEFEKRYRFALRFLRMRNNRYVTALWQRKYRIICMRCDFPRSINIVIDNIGKLEGRKECHESKIRFLRPHASLHIQLIINDSTKRFSYFSLDAIFKYKLLFTRFTCRKNLQNLYC